MLETFWNFLAAHKPTLILAFGWFIREIPVVWTALKENHGIHGFIQTIWTGQTPEKQAAAAVAKLDAISPPPTNLPPNNQPPETPSK